MLVQQARVHKTVREPAFAKPGLGTGRVPPETPPSLLEESGARMVGRRPRVLPKEIFYTLREAQILIERWRKHYNAIRPHSSLGYRPPAPETILPPASILAYAPLQPVQTLANARRILT